MGARSRAGGAMGAAPRAAPFFRAALFCAPPDPGGRRYFEQTKEGGHPALPPRCPEARSAGSRGGTPAAAAAVVSDPSAQRWGCASGRRGRGDVQRAPGWGGGAARSGPRLWAVAVFLASDGLGLLSLLGARCVRTPLRLQKGGGAGGVGVEGEDWELGGRAALKAAKRKVGWWWLGGLGWRGRGRDKAGVGQGAGPWAASEGRQHGIVASGAPDWQALGLLVQA